jgi:hypothetical protein
MHLSASAAGWIAVGAAAVAVAALGIAAAQYLTVRRLRRAQLAVLGGGASDLVDFAVSLQRRIDELHRAVDGVIGSLDRVERRVDETVSKTAIVRYDAYEHSGGHLRAHLRERARPRPCVRRALAGGARSCRARDVHLSPPGVNAG